MLLGLTALSVARTARTLRSRTVSRSRPYAPMWESAPPLGVLARLIVLVRFASSGALVAVRVLASARLSLSWTTNSSRRANSLALATVRLAICRFSRRRPRMTSSRKVMTWSVSQLSPARLTRIASGWRRSSPTKRRKASSCVSQTATVATHRRLPPQRMRVVTRRRWSAAVAECASRLSWTPPRIRPKAIACAFQSTSAPCASSLVRLCLDAPVQIAVPAATESARKLVKRRPTAIATRSSSVMPAQTPLRQSSTSRCLTTCS
mmetsp:Transcript_31702/g.75254  ORF Transcript_31702/g.75254 Transcript_31702/m.75254 type:complete len:264 (-) Transcript_31702:1579-2370(-)